MGPDHAVGFVRQHLRDRGVIPASNDGLYITSEPGTSGNYVSKVRRALREPPWEKPFREELLAALLKLPEARLLTSPPGADMYTVVWEVPD
jgi:hypothetical protein